MRIAVISYWVCPLTKIGTRTGGGMSVYIINLINNLSRKGHEIDVYTIAHRDRHEHITKSGKCCRIIHLPLRRPDTGQFARKVIEYIRRNSLSYDLLHSHYYLSGEAAIMIRKVFPMPLFHTFHTLAKIKEKYLGITDKNRFEKEIKIVNEVDCIIVSTELEKKDLVRYYHAEKRKIEIVYPGVNHKIFKKIPKTNARLKTGMDPEDRIILFIGRPDPVKGMETLVRAFVELVRKYNMTGLKLVIIGGDKKQKGGISEILSGIDITEEEMTIINKNVQFLGRMNYSLLPDYYNSSDIVTIPSVYESFGLVVLEAMACGCAVVASNSGGPSVLIRNDFNGILFKADDVKKLSEILFGLLNDEKRREFLGSNAMIQSQKYCWDKQSDRIIKLYGKYL